MNSVTLYSNGTAVISRDYPVANAEPLRISIPVRKSDLDDVVSSLSVFGDVTVIGPPSYTPTNAQETELAINPTCALKEFATKLAGAEVEVEAGLVYRGRLVGLNQAKKMVNERVLEVNLIVLLTSKGIQQIEESAITAIRFTSSLIQAEIDKALRASVGKIRPDSSVVELTLQSHAGPTNAVVMYATPVAAWKIRYQLRMTEGETELEGQAVIDNDTDDDWKETLITVITGEPITFSTDLAEIRRPARSRVNIVAEHATGAVSAEPSIVMAGPAYRSSADEEFSEPRMFRKNMLMGGMPESPPPRAIQEQAEVRESGDFSVFTSPQPVSVGAKRSAIIPLFRTAVGEAKAVLFYKEADDPQRPFRAVRFKNTAEHSLGRGVCEVIVDGDFQGKCVLESTKQGEEALLIHAKETGVRVFKESTRPQSRRMSIRVSEGTASGETLHRINSKYRIQNSHRQPFSLEIEHSRSWEDSRIEASVSSGELTTTDIPSGKRYRVELEAAGSLILTVKEELLETQWFTLDGSWLIQNVVEVHAPAMEDPGIKKCIALQKDRDALVNEVRRLKSQASTLEEEQKRLIKLIPNGHAEQANEWRNDLANAEKELRDIKRKMLPDLRKQGKAVQEKLYDALTELQYDWSADGN